MTCGLCHRNPDEHSLSTSGPTRCKYTTHRPDCPDNFSTKCSDHVINGSIAPPGPEPPENEEKLDISELIKKLDIQPGHENAVSPGQQTPVGPQTPQITDQAWGKVSLEGIEKMIRDHVSKNQQHLQLQTPSLTSYDGPNMAQIRKDPHVQTQADLIMNTLKTNLPVFGQNTSNGAAPGAGPAQPSFPGINPLQGLQQLLQGLPQQGQPQQGQPQQGQLPYNQPQYVQPQYGQSPYPQPVYGQTQVLQTLLSQLQQPPAPLQYRPQQQPQVQNLVQHPPQIPPDLLSSLAQIGPSAAPLLQALLQQAAPPNNSTQQVQPAQWGPAGQQPQQVSGILGPGQPGGYQNYGPQLQVPGLLQQNPHLAALLGQTHLQQPPAQLHPYKQQAAQGNTSMTGVMYARPTEFSKFCTVDYAKKAKPDNCNLVLYVWGYLAQILAAKQGQITPMPEQEQIGRLQHLLHVMELCAMQSSSTEFNTQAWLCARNYSDRVFQDLDSGVTSWSQIGFKMHPTNMMMSMSAHPKVAPEKTKVKGAGGIIQQDSSPAALCPKWGSCEVEDKCQWEVDNPGKSCNRSHHCSFCLKKFKQTRKHKETDCRKKGEAGEDQPT